jgi:hypothetical protein
MAGRLITFFPRMAVLYGYAAFTTAGVMEVGVLTRTWWYLPTGPGKPTFMLAFFGLQLLFAWGANAFYGQPLKPASPRAVAMARKAERLFLTYAGAAFAVTLWRVSKDQSVLFFWANVFLAALFLYLSVLIIGAWTIGFDNFRTHKPRSSARPWL